ncbi:MULTISPECIES: helix-turn-helix domain-containing protein [Vibrio]|uniref:helix-turn-helix domain-containing protein n=2 Tax=Vibrionaceae TaxID=641 RepID=UPI00068BEFAE|nr:MULTISPECIES: XRE family transcriptional regulator [Vibrio]ELA7519193.1 XRE family transcriptional regulator [Vibrio parahaemolyticus]EHU5001505.1 XRE family transcriptional regulator [Vibrio vulnificus]MBN8129833.1 XRE family transcriptional regulator [Vibrio vulnificus]MBN8157545.1 XRE family transcriptional regulator [Vibrio vulnificus]HCG8520773.1 XRE family transcriptional regulator [Vibrio parahaemolyticus]
MSNKLKYDNSTLNKIALMKAIGNKIKDDNLKQREVAEILDIKQPRVSDLIRLKHERFTLDTLIGYLEIFGSIIKIEEKELVNRKSNLVDVKALKCKPKYRSIVLN